MVKLPSWTTAGRTHSDQVPSGSKFPIAHAQAEDLQWRGGRMITQTVDGYHFRLELREWDLEKLLEIDMELNSPVILLFYGFKGHLNCLHRQSKTLISLLPGQYGMINLPAGNYTLKVRRGQTLTFHFRIDPQFLDWLKTYNKEFSVLADYKHNSFTFFKFPFCNIDFTVGRIIRQLRILNHMKPPNSAALSEKLVTMLMLYQKQLASPDAQRHLMPAEKVERIQSFIDEEISKTSISSIPEIARMFAIGHRTLRRLFKNQTGMSLHAYLHRARMEEGFKQLKANVSVTEVSQNLGYGSIAAFSKSFTKYFGFPPENTIKN